MMCRGNYRATRLHAAAIAGIAADPSLLDGHSCAARR